MYVIICFEDIKFLGVDLGLIKILCGFFKDLFWFVWDFYYDLIIIEERGGFFFFWRECVMIFWLLMGGVFLFSINWWELSCMSFL